MGSSLDSTIALVSSTDMANYLGVSITATASVTEMDLLINGASQLALDWTGRTTLVSSTALVEFYQADYGMSFETRSWPINSVTTLEVDITGQFASTTTTVLTEGTDFQVEEGGRIFSIASPFLKGLGNCNSIKLSYAAGYSTIPYDLQLATKELVQFWYFRKLDKRVGKRSQTAGDTTQSYEPDIPSNVQTILDKYRSKSWVVS